MGYQELFRDPSRLGEAGELWGCQGATATGEFSKPQRGARSATAAASLRVFKTYYLNYLAFL